ncbi:MAG: hypothetical protein R3E90_00190 [Marinicella sp.]|nr:hypothetical protein [Xanthomonadales bacterium]
MRVGVLVMMLVLFCYARASQKAVTEQGDVVVLNDDGTWVYENGAAAVPVAISKNPKLFSAPSNANFQLKSNRTDVAFKFDPKQWNFSKDEQGEAAEYNFKLKSGDLYAMAITEQLEIALETLVDIAVDNARDAAPDIQVVTKEYRNVNGLKVIYMEMEGAIQKVRFTYLGYYYSDASGSVQYLAYTGTNLVQKYRKDIDQFLNGLVLQ